MGVARMNECPVAFFSESRSCPHDGLEVIEVLVHGLNLCAVTIFRIFAAILVQILQIKKKKSNIAVQNVQRTFQPGAAEQLPLAVEVWFGKPSTNSEV